MPNREDLGFSEKDPGELSFVDSAAEDAYTNQLRSDSPSTVARALGIDAAKAEQMDPNAILRLGRSRVRDYEAKRGQQIFTREAAKDETRGGVPIDKAFLESQAGFPGSDVQGLKADVERTGGTSRDDQQNLWTKMPLDIANKVKNHDVRGAWKSALDYLTYSKKLDALYFQTQSGIDAGQIKDPKIAAMMQKQVQPGKKTGPYESHALATLFDSNSKILPDYLSQGDAQMLGMTPSTQMGGAAGSGAPMQAGGQAQALPPGMVQQPQGMQTGTNPSFTNVGPGTQQPGEPSMNATLGGVTPGATPPAPSSGATPPPQGGAGAPMQSPAAAPGGSSQMLRVRVKATGQTGTIPANEFNPSIYDLAH